MEKNIGLKDIIKVASNNEDWTKKVRVRPYIPIVEKGTVCRKYMLDFEMMNNGISDSVFLALQQELLWKFDVLFEYTNVSIEKEDKTYANYDLCTTYGIFDYIHKLCETDYVKMRNMIDKSTGIENVNTVFTLLSGFALDETVKSLKETVSQLKDEKLIEQLNDLVAFNNPALAQFVEANRMREVKEQMAKKK